MRFTFELILERDRASVWKAFDKVENLRKWQPTLESFEPVSGTPGQPGAVSRLTYREGGRTVTLIETITVRREPEEFAGAYDSGSAVNTVRNRFEEAGPGRTRWVVSAEFEFHGLWRLLGPLFRGMIRKRLTGDVERFKQKLEAGEL